MKKTVAILKLTAAVLAFVMCLALVITLDGISSKALFMGGKDRIPTTSSEFYLYFSESTMSDYGVLERSGVPVSSVVNVIVGLLAIGMVASLVGVAANILQIVIANGRDVVIMKNTKQKQGNVMTLEEAKEMLEVGAISQEEYEAFRAKVIKEKLGI